jgi:hypothetical protein
MGHKGFLIAPAYFQHITYPFLAFKIGDHYVAFFDFR